MALYLIPPLSFSAPLSTHTSHSTPSPLLSLTSHFSTATAAADKHTPHLLSLSSPLRRRKPLLHHLPPPLPRNDRSAALTLGLSSRRITCKATEVSVAEEPSAAGDGENWVPVVPLSALPKGERRALLRLMQAISCKLASAWSSSRYSCSTSAIFSFKRLRITSNWQLRLHIWSIFAAKSTPWYWKLHQIPQPSQEALQRLC
ncbi:unnamed protein product, partial [Vitis vinifera]